MRAHWFACLLLLAACGGDGGTSQPQSVPAPTVPAPFGFREVTPADLERVRDIWRARDLAAQDMGIALEDDHSGTHRVTIYRHSVGSNTHYGLVSVPVAAPGAVDGYPIVVFTDGLTQSNPTMDGETVLGYFASILDRAVVAIPTFRGRTLLYDGRSFPAEGDFCDAYDGAADDTIALLNVIAQAVPTADASRVLVRGGSRGGNTALLLAIRDERVRIADATAAPVDFYREEVRIRYGGQYTCQFFTGKSEQESRDKMLASSPLHFAAHDFIEQVYLYHGTVDAIVPLWNAEELHEHLAMAGTDIVYRTYEGVGHIDIYSLAEYQAAQAEAMALFLLDT